VQRSLPAFPGGQHGVESVCQEPPRIRFISGLSFVNLGENNPKTEAVAPVVGIVTDEVGAAEEIRFEIIPAAAAN